MKLLHCQPVDTPWIYDLFFDLQHGFNPASLTVDHMIVVPVTIARTFYKSSVACAVVCDVSKALKWVCHTGFIH